MRHADDDFVEVVLGGLVDHGVHHRDDGLGALEREPLLADVLGLQEGLEGLGGVELAQDVLLLGDRRLVVLDLDALLNPLLLLGFQDVGVLDADVAAVRVAQHREHVAQLLVLRAGETVDLEHAVEVPQRQAVGDDVEVGVAAEPGLVEPQRVDVGHQVSAVAVGRDQLDDAGVLVEDRVRVVDAPADRLVRDAQLAEDLVEEVVAQQQLVDGAQEVAGLRALDDAVVVGRRQRHQLADAHLGDAFLAGALELGRVLHGAGADDRALAAHQPRHRVHGADGARVGQRDGHACEVLGGQLAVAGAPHDVLVGGDELAESHCLATLDRGHDELTVAVLARQVDGQTEVGVRGGDHVRLAVDLGEVPVHVREALDRLDDRVPEQVGERDLAAAGALEVVVDDDAVVDHQLGRDGPHAGGGRHVQRGVHVLDDGCGGTTKHGHLVIVAGRGTGGGLGAWRARPSRRRARPSAAGSALAGSALAGSALAAAGAGLGSGVGAGLASAGGAGFGVGGAVGPPLAPARTDDA